MNIVSIHEGGFSDNPNDLGGSTNFGISLRFLKLVNEDVNSDGHVDEKDIKVLSKERALELYKKYFWDHYGLGGISCDWPATKALDLFVNMRGRTACKILQRSCVVMDLNIAIDGIIGPKTIDAINAAYCFDLEAFKHTVRDHQKQVYTKIVQKNPSQNEFLKGWLNRARY